MNTSAHRALVKLFFVAAASLHMASAMAASAGSGSAFGLHANLAVDPPIGPTVTLIVGPAPSGVNGSAPPDFDDSGTVVGVSGSILGGAVAVGSGTLNASTESVLLGNTVLSNASVENLNLALTLAGLQAQTVTSSATATCTANSVTLGGSSHLVGVSLAGLLVGASVDAFPLPNTVILNTLGIKVTLNEQIFSGNQLTVNAIHIEIDDGLLPLLGLLSGDIYVAQSVASMADCALPDLAMSKSGPSTATLGTPFDYVLSLANVGALETSGTITVTDIVPASLAINNVAAGANFNCSLAGQTVTCTSDTPIGAGASNVTVATITVTPTQLGQVSNTAVAGGGGDNAPGNNTSPPIGTTVNPAPVPDLALSKSGPGTATIGSAFDYVLTLANVGTGPTTGLITVTDTIAGSVTINNVIAGANFNCVTASQTVTCTSNVAIGAGTSNVPVATINVTANAAGQISNTAVVTGGGDNTPPNNSSPPVETTVNPAPVADLTPSKSGPGTATVGIPFDYVITLANVGTGPTTDTFTVTDAVPAGLTIDNVASGASFTCGVMAQTVTCTSNAVIASGASGVTVATISVTPTQVGPIGNTAVVSGGGDSSPGNNASPPVNTTVNAAPVPDLEMSKSGPGTATVGVAFNYSLTLANVGTGPTSGTVTVSDVLPAGLTINSATGGAGFNCGTNGQTVTCSTGTTIPNGATGVVVATINVTPTTAGSISNTATASGGGDNTPANNTSPPVNTSVGNAPTPDLAMSKSGPGTATVGIAFEYTLTVSNVGTGPTSGTVTVTDSIPAGVTIDNIVAGANFSCGSNGQLVTCSSNAVIGTGASGLLVATVTVTPTAVGPIGNTASVSGGGDSSPGNNTSPPVNTSVSAAPVPDLAMGKSGPGSATIGVAYDYVLTLSNVGTGPTSGMITVTDSIASGLTINSALGSSGFVCTINGQLVTCTSNATIANGVTGIVVATISVTPTTAGPLSNTATVAGGGDNSPANNTSPPVNTSVGSQPVPDLTPEMTGPSTAVVGTPFNYVITVSNIGNAPTSGPFTIVDVIPSGLTIGNVTAGPDFTCSVVLQTVSCVRSTPLAPGASDAHVATITVTPAGVGGVTNTATVSGGGDISPANNTTPPVNTAVGASPAPDLEMGKSGPAAADIRVAFDYTLTLSNIGTGPTLGTVTVTDVVDPSLGVGNVAAGANFNCGVNAQTVTCTTNTSIVAGAQNVLVATVTVVPNVGGTTVSNVASVDGGGDDTPGNNISPPVNTSVGPLARPDLDVMKFGPRTAPIGVQYSYTITISNVGTAATSGLITVVDTVPPTLTINSIVGESGFSCSINDHQVICTSSAVITAGTTDLPVVVISVTATSAGAIENTAFVEGGGDDTPSNNVSPPVVTDLVVLRPGDGVVRPIPTLSPMMLVVLALLVALFAIFGLLGGPPRRRQ